MEVAEGYRIPSFAGSLPLLHTSEQDDSHAEASLVTQMDRAGHLLVVVSQVVGARTKPRFTEFHIVVAAGFLEIGHLRVLGRRIRGKRAVQPDRLEGPR